MLWSYHWRVLSPEKQESRGSSDTQRKVGRNGLRHLRLPDLSNWLWGLWKHTLQTRFPIREFWSRTRSVGWVPADRAPKHLTGCLAEPVADWMPCREAALISDNSEQLRLPGIAIALKLLVCFSSLVAYNDLMGICKQLPAWASTGTAGRPSKPRLLLGKLCSQALLLELLTNS